MGAALGMSFLGAALVAAFGVDLAICFYWVVEQRTENIIHSAIGDRIIKAKIERNLNQQ